MRFDFSIGSELRIAIELTSGRAPSGEPRKRFRLGHSLLGKSLIPEMNNESGPLVLRATSGRRVKAIGALLFAGFWNGIVSVFVVQVIHGAMRGSFEWFLAIFLIPFVLVGLGAIAFFVHSFLGVFAPKTMLTLSTGQIRLGDSVEVEWQFTGRVQVIEKLTICLEGCEEATYRRGTSTSTDRHVFARVPIIISSDMNQIRSGRARLPVPADTVPTFQARNNKIVWNLRVNGVIRRFPDIADTFAVHVGPALVREENA
jgi:hypothetical protein